MKRSLHLPDAPRAASSFRLTQLVRATLLAGLTMAATSAAHADTTLTFGTGLSGDLTVGQSFVSNGLEIAAYSFDTEAQPTDLVGAVVDGTDAVAACGALQCPSSNGSYLTGLNDGIIEIVSTTPGQLLSLKSFDASFLGSSSFNYPATAGLLVVQGYKVGGGFDEKTYALNGPATNGFQFGLFDSSATFGTAQYIGFDFFSAACNDDGDCFAGSTGRGQFALDNISFGTAVAAVPEPQTWLMLGAGLLAIGGAARRRSSGNSSSGNSSSGSSSSAAA
jgi:hypothetical protein